MQPNQVRKLERENEELENMCVCVKERLRNHVTLAILTLNIDTSMETYNVF